MLSVYDLERAFSVAIELAIILCGFGLGIGFTFWLIVLICKWADRDT